MSVSPGEFLKWLLVFKVPFGGGVGGDITINTGYGLQGGGTVSPGGSLTLSAVGGWVDVTTTSQQMDTNFSYAADNASQVNLTMPLTAEVGDILLVYGKGDGGWKISQNAGQKIIIGEAETTVGVTGSVESTYKEDILVLRCTEADTTWTAYCPSGNLTVN